MRDRLSTVYITHILTYYVYCDIHVITVHVFICTMYIFLGGSPRTWSPSITNFERFSHGRRYAHHALYMYMYYFYLHANGYDIILLLS